MRRGFKVNQPETFDTVTVVHTGHRKDIRAIVDFRKFIVRQVAQKPNAKIGFRRSGRPKRGFVVIFALPANDPVLEPGTNLRRKCLQGFQGDELTFSRMETADRKNDDLVLRLGPFGRKHGQIGPQGSGCQKNLAGSFGEMREQQFLSVIREGRHARRSADQSPSQTAGATDCGQTSEFQNHERLAPTG